MKKGFASIFLVAAIAILALFGIENILKSSPKSDPSPSPYYPQNKVQKSSFKPSPELEKYLTVEAALLGISDNISLYFKDLTSFSEVSIDPTRSWIPASTIKSFVVVEAFRQRRLGLISFNHSVVISAKNVVPTELETDDFPRLREGVSVTIGQLVEAMVEQSDNTAYNTLLDVLDRRNITQTLRNLGITETVVGEKLNLDDGQLAIDLKVPGRQPVTTTAKDLATLFGLMYLNKIPDSQEMLDIFKRQKINNMIPALLPQNVAVAHKTGDWAPIYHDGGIVYKENAPFILSVFTNSNDPSIIARISKVAYFQDAKSVGLGVEKTQENSNTSSIGARPNYFLAAADISSSKVLAAQTSELSPKITAADLGITAEDLNSNVAVGADVKGALITPTSPFYLIKKFIDNLRLKFAAKPEQKLNVEISLSRNRLAEFENEIQRGNIASAQSLLDQSEQNLKQSVSELLSTEVNDNDLLKIKQENDLNFKTLSKIAKDLPDDKKEPFVDIVYGFIKDNESEIKRVVNKTLAITKSTSQEPIIGTVVNATDKSVTIKFDDGSTKEVVISDLIPTRDFNSSNSDKITQLSIDSKIAIIGQEARDGKIIPQFILGNIPKNIPDKNHGTVTEINPNRGSIKILTSSGVQQEVRVDNKTQIKSKDTNVSLEGIKAGSEVTVFGTGGNKGSGSNNNNSAQSQSINTGTQNTIQAQTVTVTKNDSGFKENKNQPGSSKPGDDKKNSSKNQSLPSTSVNKQESQKTEDKKP